MSGVKSYVRAPSSTTPRALITYMAVLYMMYIDTTTIIIPSASTAQVTLSIINVAP
jgi:hypothetical protein